LPFKTHLGVSASVMLKLRRHHFQNALAEHLNQQGKELILFIAPISGVSDTLALPLRLSHAVEVTLPAIVDVHRCGRMPPVERPIRWDSRTKSSLPTPVSSSARPNKGT